MRGNRGEVVVVSAASSLCLHGHISWRVGGRCRIMAVCLLCKVAGCSVLGVYSAAVSAWCPASLPRSIAAVRASLRAATSRPLSSFFFCRTRKFNSTHVGYMHNRLQPEHCAGMQGVMFPPKLVHSSSQRMSNSPLFWLS
ncbi:hypothetical protein PBY51_010986 [Eleginops maclovinus]|uniref:Uncharacterized protein n=1 Tax=Eleginops maclovinus TaxID=56733 RepID=A0AAN7X8X5_ELEMC|nr:hypothetical protein PBY51_010986 [Eleginops maclovinus]